MTADEVLAYNGNPNLAYGSNALPAGSNSQVVNTQPAIDAWDKYATYKFALARQNQEELQKQQLATQAEVSKVLNQGQYKIWDADRDNFLKIWNPYAENVVKLAQSGQWGNINNPDYVKALQTADQLDQYAQFSTQQAEHYKTTDNMYQSKKNDYLPTSQQNLDAYKGIGDPIQRAGMDINLDPKIGFDLTKYYTPVLTRIKNDNPNLTAGKPDNNGYATYSHTGELNTQGAVDIGEGAWNSDPSAQEYGEYLQSQNPSEFANAHDAFISHFVAATVPNSLPSEIKGVNYAPAGLQAEKPVMNWIVDNAIALNNPKSDIFTEDLVNKKGDQIGRVSHSFDNLFIQVGGRDANGKPIYTPIKGIYNINGKVYANTEAKEQATGLTALKDLVEITSPYTQLIIPYSNQQYGSSPALAKGIEQLTNYGKEIDKSNFLKIPNSQVTATPTKTAYKYSATSNVGKKVFSNDGVIWFDENGNTIK